MATKIKPKRNYWIIGAFSFLWYFVGIIVLFRENIVPEFVINEIADIQLDFIINKPAWVVFAYGLYAIFGLLGSITLLAQRKIAYFLFLISFIASMVRLAYNIITINIIDVYGKVGVALVIVTLFISIFLLIFSRSAKKVGILK
ncbi:hypothetical protein [Polaribacter sp. Hel_I_88]|uniref:hypothetical protein n=1 Tax=Polaribacter sp. Hel_I_88 TaxID=1250006 RepID=UPI000B24926E|nr:hypothetical protein [Polaribacter sp. Hel_I_88]